MRQLQPEQTRGHWRVGEESELFGRFARGWANPTNTSAVLALELDRGLWGGLPLRSLRSASALELTVRVVFLDARIGAFSVGYDAAAGPKVLVKIVKSGTGKWKELCRRISDAKFGGAGPGGSDLWLENADRYEDVFSSLEVAEGSPKSLTFNGCNENAADDDDHDVVGYR